MNKMGDKKISGKSISGYPYSPLNFKVNLFSLADFKLIFPWDSLINSGMDQIRYFI